MRVRRSARASRGVAIAAAGAVLLVASGRADVVAPHATTPSVVADLAVGSVFLLAGVLTRAALPARLVLAGVGVAWLLASLVPEWSGWHQGLLLVALAMVSGTTDRRLLVAVGLLGVATALGLEMPVVAAAFAATAVLLGFPRGHLAQSRGVAIASCLLVATCLAVVAWLSDVAPAWTSPEQTLLAYEVVLVAVAVLVTSTSRLAGPAALTGRLLHDGGTGGLPGLAAVLARTLRDPSLRVLRPDEATPGMPALSVTEHGRVVALVAHASAPLEDPATAMAVSAAVRLTLAHDDLLAGQERQLRELMATRSRIVAAADRQRSSAAGTLRSDVETLHRVGGRLATLGAASQPTATTLAIVSHELRTAASEIEDLVSGIPPAELGRGRLVPALRALGDRSPVPVSLDAGPGLAADAAVETTAYFVCAEALTNAVKHAGAARLEVRIRQVSDVVEVRIRDDGRGGADPAGRGLAGLADRVAAVGGRLRVESPHGDGTVVVARFPSGVRRSWSRA